MDGARPMTGWTDLVGGLAAVLTTVSFVPQASARPAAQAGRLGQGRNTRLRLGAPRPAGRARPDPWCANGLERGSRGCEEFVHRLSRLATRW